MFPEYEGSLDQAITRIERSHKSDNSGWLLVSVGVGILCLLCFGVVVSLSVYQPQNWREIGPGDITTVSGERNWIVSDYDRFDRCTTIEDYLQAQEDGLARQLEPGAKIRIRSSVLPIAKYWSRQYEVEVLDGELAGEVGWTSYGTLADHYIDY